MGLGFRELHRTAQKRAAYPKSRRERSTGVDIGEGSPNVPQRPWLSFPGGTQRSQPLLPLPLHSTSLCPEEVVPKDPPQAALDAGTPGRVPGQQDRAVRSAGPEAQDTVGEGSGWDSRAGASSPPEVIYTTWPWPKAPTGHLLVCLDQRGDTVPAYSPRPIWVPRTRQNTLLSQDSVFLVPQLRPPRQPQAPASFRPCPGPCSSPVPFRSHSDLPGAPEIAVV